VGGDLQIGEVRLRGVSRSFHVYHERNRTLKEVLLRRRRADATELWALRDVDLDIKPGQAIGIIGENGSGKSTLLKLVAGILSPQTGTVEAGGAVAAMLELGAGFHPDFTGRENVYLNGSIHGLSERAVAGRFDEIVAFAELEDFIDMPVRSYSSGMQMRLAFAVASHVNPDILLLDEVLAVGDEAFQRKCFGRIFDFRRRGGTLLFVSHDPSTIERVCDRVILLLDGEIAADGRPDEVVSRYHRLLANAASEPTRRETNDSDDSQSWGTREVAIESVQLVGPSGATDRFMSGDPFAVAIRLRSGNRVATPVVGIAVHSADGSLCYGTNTHLDELPIDVIDGTLTVRFGVNALALHEGRFFLTIAVHSADGRDVYHWLDRWLEFTVFQRTAGIGNVDLSGSWAVGEAADGEIRGAGRLAPEAFIEN